MALKNSDDETIEGENAKKISMEVRNRPKILFFFDNVY